MTPEWNGFPKSVRELIAAVVKHARPKRVVLFGSRARGSGRPNSDFDIAVVGKTASEREWAEFLTDLEEQPITLEQIDLVEFESLSSAHQEAILREGKVLYERSDHLQESVKRT